MDWSSRLTGVCNQMSEITIGRPDSDPILPMEIRHDVDEIIFDGEVEQNYNFLDYRFERQGAHCHARTYLDDVDTVSVNGPFSDRDSEDEIDAPEFFEDVLSYLKRRFLIIDAPGDSGYDTIWKHPDFK